MAVQKVSEKDVRPKVLAVGGGKGGVGKSVVTVLLALALARMGKKTILVDADFGGSNLHTLIGIKTTPRTLNDFLLKKYSSLEEICLELGVDNLRLISGASEVLSLANLHVAQKTKIIQHVFHLDADYVVMDLGAGSSFNVLDFFLAAHLKILVLTAQPTSIQNAYAFVRNAVYRRLSRLVSQRPTIQEIVRTAMSPENPLRVRTIQELLAAIEASENGSFVESLRNGLKDVQPWVITNMIREDRDKNAGRIIELVSRKYLTVNPIEGGSVPFDSRVETMVSAMVPFTQLDSGASAFVALRTILEKIVTERA